MDPEVQKDAPSVTGVSPTGFSIVSVNQEKQNTDVEINRWKDGERMIPTVIHGLAMVSLAAVNLVSS